MPKVTLVIGSGGVKCAAALGVVKALADADIGIERVVGCSTGAISAALVAFGHSLDESKAVTMRLWTQELARRPGMLGLLRTAARRSDHALLPRRLAEVFGDKRIEDAKVPLHLTATDFATGELVELVAGSLTEGLRASLAMPPADAPQRIDGRLLVDGHLADPLPVSVAIKHGARVIVAVGFERALEDCAERGGRASIRLNAILANNLLRAKLAFHGVAHHAEMIILMPEFKHRGVVDTDKLAWIVEEGEQAALQQLPYLHHLLKEDSAPPSGSPSQL